MLQTLAMAGNGQVDSEALHPIQVIPPLTLEFAQGLADAGDRSAGQDAPVIAAKKLKLDGRTAGVEDQNLHGGRADQGLMWFKIKG